MSPPKRNDVSLGKDVRNRTTPTTPEIELPTPHNEESSVSPPDPGADLYSRVLLALNPDDIDTRRQKTDDWLEEIVKVV
jgi:hypothetical protein